MSGGSSDYIGLFGNADGAQIRNLGVETASGKNISGYMNVGVIAGDLNNNSSISNSYSAVNVNGSSTNIDGIAGYLNNNSSISNSCTVGDVNGGSGSGSDNVGGIAGVVKNGAKIINNAAINTLIAGPMDTNHIIGNTETADNTAENNFALSDMTINGAVYSGTANLKNGISKTEAELKEQSTYASPVNEDGNGGLGWDFTNIWKIDDGCPYLYWQK
ncbi:MAG: hypothetical protein LBD84_05990 [Campylobacteraceae bacterium]|jgi:hypothetical protein|nr:hypothetical protein [Campylobacteraceae bacterium]